VLSREFFHQLEDEITRARYEIDEEYHRVRLSDLLKRAPEAKFHIGGGSQVGHVEIKPHATAEEIALALSLIDQVTKRQNMGAIDRLKAKALEARNVAPDAIRTFEADLDSILAEKATIEAQRAAAVAPHKEAIAAVKGTIDGVKSAIDILDNGEI
jgi:hypothetical protein